MVVGHERVVGGLKGGRRCQLAVPMEKARSPSALPAVSAGEAVVPASELAAARADITMFQRLQAR